MPYGTGTYGSKVGRPPKKKNKSKQMLNKRKPTRASGGTRGR